jgi:hypothetical protein
MRKIIASLIAVGLLAGAHPAEASSVRFTGGKLSKQKGTANAEPGIAADGAGNLYIVAQASPTNPAEPGREILWKSTNGGRSFRPIASPLDTPGGATQLPIGGSDVDVAAAPERDPLGNYNVYTAALGPLRTNIALSYSPDGGTTWITIPSATVPALLLDRPWLSASGPCTVHMVYLALFGDPLGVIPVVAFGWFMNTYDVCGPNDAVTSITGVQMLTPDTFVLMGKFGVDASRRSRYRGSFYAPSEKCRPGGIDLTKYNYCLGGKEIFVSYSRDGTNWTRRHIANIPRGAMESWNGTVATGSTGRVYMSWFDAKNVYFSSSSSGGSRWSRPKRINVAPSLAGVYPTMAAIGRDTVEIAWYGTNRKGDANDARAMGRANGRTSAQWRVYWARSRDGGKTWSQQPVSPVVHVGRLCTLGGECDNAKDAPYNNGLLDDFTMTINPRTGRASIAYTTDRPTGSLNDASSGYQTELR